ncbi:Protein tyrosine phosphatase [Acanthamoeba polyphaga moumouvirus]|uniref:Protein tyrosine phosphatase n=1 Tax=Acanthamoeba polyphaga moumouvirus TaxID=1269028 RepID=L7RCR0_9VIRU|nr:Protein tyrosine phosphatase [Acanthamoeba polyphaga moumouvirus]AGC01818.1 Protein tyrosine phosphatase [Acanthamoeba polyphaga moumouvirus]AQN68172.1 protein tyrosine phosphatase [Saudi moumouvirus]
MKFREETNATEIINNIWLGNKFAAQDLDFITKHNIKYIINVTYDIFNKYDFINYLNFPLNNDYEHNQYFIKIMEDCYNVISYLTTNNIPFLIHCKRGHHRSACVLAYFLIKNYGFSLNESDHLKNM